MSGFGICNIICVTGICIVVKWMFIIMCCYRISYLINASKLIKLGGEIESGDLSMATLGETLNSD